MDESLLDAVNHFARDTKWLQPFISGYAVYGVALFGLLVLAGWWAARRVGAPARMAAAISAGIAPFLAVGINQPLVALVGRPRPSTTHPGLLVLAHHSADMSFPSDHATMAGAVAAGLWLVSRRLGAIAASAAVLMAGSRVYIAAHYPSDVLAGLALGAAVAVALYLLAHSLLARAVVAAGRTPLRPLFLAGPPAATRQPGRGLDPG